MWGTLKCFTSHLEGENKYAFFLTPAFIPTHYPHLQGEKRYLPRGPPLSITGSPRGPWCLGTILHSVNSPSSVTCTPPPVTPSSSIWLTSSLPGSHLCDNSREARWRTLSFSVDLLIGEWVFIFLKEIVRKCFPLKSAIISSGPGKTSEGTSQNQYISILCDSGKGCCQSGVHFLKIFKQILIGSLLCSKYHGIYILFSMKRTTWAYLVHETEPGALLLWVVFTGLAEVSWPRGQPSHPLSPTTPSLRREHGVEDLDSSPNTKPNISLHCKIRVEALFTL